MAGVADHGAEVEAEGSVGDLAVRVLKLSSLVRYAFRYLLPHLKLVFLVFGFKKSCRVLNFYFICSFFFDNIFILILILF